MSEGDFKKRIDETHYGGEDGACLTRYLMFDLLDAARKEFQEIYKRGLSVQEVEMEITKWFLKWLGSP